MGKKKKAPDDKRNFKKLYPVSDYEAAYNQISIDDYLEAVRNKGVGHYRTRAILSGEYLELEIYPVLKHYDTHQGPREKDRKPSRKAQANLNEINRKKRLVRTIQTNFSDKGLYCTFTYDNSNPPADDKQAHKDIKNYFRRLKRYIKENGLPELKYIYTTEYTVNSETGKTHAHHHIVMNFDDRDKAEELWTKGRKETKYLQPDEFGLSGLANYLAKPETKEHKRKGAKYYGCSKNWEKPKEMPSSDSKVKKRDVIKLAENANEGKSFFENLYKKYYGNNYKFLDMEIKYSRFVTGAYVYVRMKKNQVSTIRRR